MKKKSLILFFLPFILVLTSCLTIATIDYQNREINYNTDNLVDNTKATEQHLKSYSFEYDLLRLTYALNYTNNYDINVTNEENLKTIYGEKLSSYALTQLDSFITQANSDLQYNYYYINYFVEDKRNNSTYSNHGELKGTENDSYICTITYDESGNVTLTGNINFDVPIKTAYTSLIRNDLEMTYTSNATESVTLLKNKVFTFEIPKDTDFSTIISYSNNYLIPHADYSSHMSYVLISFFIIGIIALCLPIKKLMQFKLYQTILDIPLELSALFSFFFLVLVRDTVLYNFFYQSLLGMSLYGILLFIFLMDVLIFKYFLQYSPIKYLKEKTVTGQAIYFFINNIKQFDLADNYNMTLLKIIIVNGIAIILLPMILGWIGLIIYCIVLFVTLINFANRLKDDYQALLEVTSSIASGKFDRTLSTDLGVFNSYKDSMDTIRDDFKNAIDNEIRSEKMKTELITSVSHDLKTPLTSIVTYADLLKDENINNDKKKEYIDVIDRNALRLKNLINDLFEVSKATSGNVTLNLMDIDLISLLKQAILEYDHLFEKSSLEIKFNSNIEKAILQLDSQKTYRIITNLLVNISKYALENTRVYIEVNEFNNQIEVTLKNISKYEIQMNAAELVERFVQGDSSRHSEGSGLGLAIAKTFTELQGGTCNVNVDGDLFKVSLIFNKN